MKATLKEVVRFINHEIEVTDGTCNKFHLTLQTNPQGLQYSIIHIEEYGHGYLISVPGAGARLALTFTKRDLTTEKLDEYLTLSSRTLNEPYDKDNITILIR